jgi:hypothetical protein
MYGREDVQIHVFLTSALFGGMSDQFHVPAALLPGVNECVSQN